MDTIDVSSIDKRLDMELARRESIAEDNTADMGDSRDENQHRGNWTGKADFLLSCIGFAVGLGNIWRFPFLAYRNGGGAFLIPYAIMLTIAGLPLFFMELSFGQFANLGPISVWRVAPLFKGVGYAMVIISALVCIYYNVIIGWAFYYIFAGFTSKLPWADCTFAWNDEACRVRYMNGSEIAVVPNPRPINFTLDCTDTRKINCTRYQTPAEQYWEREVLGLTDYNGKVRTLDDGIGMPQWHITLCLLLAWILVFVCLIKGVKSSGKVVYFTALFPYVVLIILLARGLTLQGSTTGVLFYITPNWPTLANAKVWGDAAVQIFYSLGVSFGGLQTMASYNRFKNNCYRDALIVAILNCCTSVFAGFVIFSVIGHMAWKTGVDVKDVVKEGAGLAFVAYPEGVAAMPVSQIWSFLFFLMILTLGVDSQFAMMETVISGLVDEFPILRKTKKHKVATVGILCLILFFLGIPLCCKGGIFYFTLIDWYSAGFSLMITAFVEIVAINYVYGIRNFMWDIKMMTGYRPQPYWVGCWLVVTPLAIVFIFIFSIFNYSRVSYGGYTFPDFMNTLGWLMTFCSIIFIPILAIIEMSKRGLCTVLKRTSRPELKWGPSVDKFWPEDPRYAEKLRLRQELEKKRGQPPSYSNSGFAKSDENITKL